MFSFLFLGLIIFGCVEVSNKDRSRPPGKVPDEISLAEETDEKGFVIKLSWEAPEDRGTTITGGAAGIPSYNVEISSSSDFTDSILYTANETTLEIRDLEASGELYYIRVTAKNSAELFGESSRVFKNIIGRPSLATPPDPPTELVIVEGSLTSTDVRFIWNVPTNTGKKKDGSLAEIESYVMQYSFTNTFESKVVIESSDLGGHLINLSRNLKYYFRVLTKNNNEDSDKEISVPSKTIVFTTSGQSPTPPEPPSEVLLKEGSLTTSSALIFWRVPLSSGTVDGINPASIVRYEIQYSLEKDFSVDRWTVYTEGRETEKQIQNLISANTYFVRVRTINDNEDENKRTSTYTNLSEGFRVQAPLNAGNSSPPEPVSSVVFTNVGELKAKINWSAVTNPGRKVDGSLASILNYIVEYADNAALDNKKTFTIGSGDALEQRLLSLTVSTNYYVRVRAKNNNDVKGFDQSVSKVITFNTLSPSPPKQPSNFIAQLSQGDLAKTQVDISWSFNQASDSGLRGNSVDKANVQGFEIEYSIDNFTNDIQRVIPNLAPNIIGSSISGLKSNTTYKFRIRAVNDNNVSDSDTRKEAVSKFAVSQEVTTLSNESAPLSPPNLIVTLPDGDEGRTEVMASWQSPDDFGRKPDGTNAEEKHYILDYFEGNTFPIDNSDESINRLSTLYKDDLTLDVIGLKPNTNYIFRVRAKNTNEGNYESSSISDPSITKVIKTRGFSESPINPVLTKSNDFPMGGTAYNSVKVIWEAVTNAGKKADGTTQGIDVQGYKSRIYPKFNDIVTKTETLPDDTTNPFSAVSQSLVFEEIGLVEETIYILEVVTVSNNPEDEYKNSQISQLEFTTTRAPRYQVTFNTTQGGSVIDPKEVAEGQNVMEPTPQPQKVDHTFDGWYKEIIYTNAFDFDTEVITQDTEIFAKFIMN